jgi:hypothetical protein
MSDRGDVFLCSAVEYQMTLTEDLLTRCQVDGGCSCLRELSKVERLIGCDPTAKFYERTADRCSDQGCWALLLHLKQVSSPDRLRRSPFALRAGRARSEAKLHGAHRQKGQFVPFVRTDIADVVSGEEGDFVERRPRRSTVSMRRSRWVTCMTMAVAPQYDQAPSREPSTRCI